ncbi:MAG: hypothetical protein AB1416_05790 [Actinomycetota bacterium]
MTRRARLLVVAVALGAAVALGPAVVITPDAAPAAGGRGVTAHDRPEPKLTLGVAVFGGGEVKGIVSAAQEGRRRTATLSISVIRGGGGVDEARQAPPLWNFRVVGSGQPCSARHKGPAVFTVDGQAMQDVFVTELVRTSGPLSRAKSVRISLVAADGTRPHTACRPFRVAVQYLGGTADGTGI